MVKRLVEEILHLRFPPPPTHPVINGMYGVLVGQRFPPSALGDIRGTYRDTQGDTGGLGLRTQVLRFPLMGVSAVRSGKGYGILGSIFGPCQSRSTNTSEFRAFIGPVTSIASCCRFVACARDLFNNQAPLNPKP